MPRTALKFMAFAIEWITIYTGRKGILGDRFEVVEHKLSPEHVSIEMPLRCKSGNPKSLIRYDTEFKKEI